VFIIKNICDRLVPIHTDGHSDFPHKGFFNFTRCADKYLAQPGSKQANISVRMALISFSALPFKKKKLDYSPRLDVVEIARVH